MKASLAKPHPNRVRLGCGLARLHEGQPRDKRRCTVKLPKCHYAGTNMRGLLNVQVRQQLGGDLLNVHSQPAI